MALNLAGKAAIGVVGTGVVGSVGVGGCFYLTRPTPIEIEKLIAKEHTGKEILNSSNKTRGIDAWNNYKNNASNTNKPAGQDAWTITGWPVAEPRTGPTVNEAPDGLVTACQNKKKEKVKDNQDPAYKNFVSWCLVNKG